MSGVTNPGPSPVLRLTGLRKTFGAIEAVRHFSLDLHAGEILALVGDNGAGKSTIVNIVSGVYPPSSGEIEIEGKAADFKDASDARARGIEVVYQDLALANRQPVYMNMFLGREILRPRTRLLDRRAMVTETEKLVRELDIRVPSVRALTRDLSGGQRQGVAIARAVRWARKLILLDEPTAALGVAESARVEAIVAGLRQRDLGVLLISHRLDQVFRLADRVCVLRQGEQIGVRDIAATEENEIVSMITGLN